MFVIWSGLSHNLLIGIRLFSTQSPIHLTYSILLVASFRGADIASATYLYKFSNSYSQFLHQILVASFRGADSASATYLYKASNSYSQFFHQILLVASFRGADIASATYLYKFSNSYSQFLHHILLVASIRSADITSATYLYKFPNSYSQFSSSYLTSFPFLYTLFFLPLSSLLIVPVSSCSFLYNLLIILQFSSLLIKKKTTGRNESPPKSPRKLISL